MEKIYYETDEERNSIMNIKAQDGLFLIKDAILQNEKYLVFSENPILEPQPPTAEERIAELEAENLMTMMALVELHMMILSQGGDN